MYTQGPTSQSGLDSPFNRSATLMHSRTTYDLNSHLSGTNAPATPPWGRRDPSMNVSASGSGAVSRDPSPSRRLLAESKSMNGLKHKSSFAGVGDRPVFSASTSKRNSLLGPSPGSAGPSFGTTPFGTAKPNFGGSRASQVISSDLPPSDSIYDQFARAGDAPAQRASPSRPLGSSSKAINSGSSPNKLAMPSRRDGERGAERTERLVASSTSQNASTATAGLAGRDENSTGNSVVVFGVPAHMSAALVDHFSRFGSILENAVNVPGSPPKHGPSTPVQTGPNWVRITYQDPMAAQRALRENGSVFAGHIIGCVAVTPGNAQMYTNASGRPMLNALPALQPPPIPENTVYGDRNIPRAISMPVLAESKDPKKRIEVKDGRALLSSATSKSIKTAPSLYNMRAGKRTAKQSWLGWAAKRAEEFVFGWDDL